MCADAVTELHGGGARRLRHADTVEGAYSPEPESRADDHRPEVADNRGIALAGTSVGREGLLLGEVTGQLHAPGGKRGKRSFTDNHLSWNSEERRCLQAALRSRVAGRRPRLARLLFGGPLIDGSSRDEVDI